MWILRCIVVMASKQLHKSELSLTGCVTNYNIFVEVDTVVTGDYECWISFNKHRTIIKPTDSDWPVGYESLLFIQSEKIIWPSDY